MMFLHPKLKELYDNMLRGNTEAYPDIETAIYGFIPGGQGYTLIEQLVAGEVQVSHLQEILCRGTMGFQWNTPQAVQYLQGFIEYLQTEPIEARCEKCGAEFEFGNLGDLAADSKCDCGGDLKEVSGTPTAISDPDYSGGEN